MNMYSFNFKLPINLILILSLFANELNARYKYDLFVLELTCLEELHFQRSDVPNLLYLVNSIPNNEKCKSMLCCLGMKTDVFDQSNQIDDEGFDFLIQEFINSIGGLNEQQMDNMHQTLELCN